MGNFKKTAVASAIAVTMGMAAGTANASLVTLGSAQTVTGGNNFTMLAGTNPSESNMIPSADGIGVGTGNGFGGGANNNSVSWNGTAYNASSDFGSAANMTITNTESFFGHVWTASNVQVFAPGTYSFAGGTYTVGAGQLMAHMNFAWNTSTGINVFDLWNVGTPGGTAFGNGTTQLWTGPTNPTGNTFSTKFGWTSVDTVMPDGPFAGSNANFNLKLAPVVVPVPAAAWLFGSGLMGLAAIARRKKKA